MSLLLALSPQVAEANDNECIRKVIWAEARGESEKGQNAIAHVILNRAREQNRSPCSITNDKGQFVKGLPPVHFRPRISYPDPTGGATYFRTKDLQKWLGQRRYIRIGNHTFYGR